MPIRGSFDAHGDAPSKARPRIMEVLDGTRGPQEAPMRKRRGSEAPILGTRQEVGAGIGGGTAALGPRHGIGQRTFDQRRWYGGWARGKAGQRKTPGEEQVVWR